MQANTTSGLNKAGAPGDIKNTAAGGGDKNSHGSIQKTYADRKDDEQNEYDNVEATLHYSPDTSTHRKSNLSDWKGKTSSLKSLDVSSAAKSLRENSLRMVRRVGKMRNTQSMNDAHATDNYGKLQVPGGSDSSSSEDITDYESIGKEQKSTITLEELDTLEIHTRTPGSVPDQGNHQSASANRAKATGIDAGADVDVTPADTDYYKGANASTYKHSLEVRGRERTPSLDVRGRDRNVRSLGGSLSVASSRSGIRDSSNSSGNYAARNAADRELFLNGMNRTNDAHRRKERKRIAAQQAMFALRLYPFTLLFVLLISVPFQATFVTLIHRNYNDVRQCRPNFAANVTLVVVCGALHLLVLLLYISQLYRYRDHQHIKSRGRYFLGEISILAPCTVLFSVLSTLAYMGALTGDCTFTYNANWETPSAPVSSGWSTAETYMMILLHNITAFLGLCFLAAIISRQYLLYKLFVDNRGGARIYTSRDILRIFFTPNVILAVCFTVEKILYWIAVIWVMNANANDYIRSYHNSGVKKVIVASEFVVFSLVNIPFAILSHKTREVEVEFNDWWANVRVFVLSLVLSIVTFVLRTFSRFQIEAGVLHGPFCVFLVTMYVMDSFSGPLILIYSEDPNAPNWLRKMCSAIVTLVGTGPLRALSYDDGRMEVDDSREADNSSSIELGASK